MVLNAKSSYEYKPFTKCARKMLYNTKANVEAKTDDLRSVKLCKITTEISRRCLLA